MAKTTNPFRYFMAAFLERTSQGFFGRFTERIASKLISHEAIIPKV